MPLAVDRMSAPLKNGADIFSWGDTRYCIIVFYCTSPIRSHAELNPCA